MEYVLIFIMFVAINLICMKMKIPLLSLSVACVSFFLLFLGADTLPFYPFPNMLLGLISVITIIQAINDMK